MSYRFHDTTRTVLRVSGADSRPFLQNLVTNDVDGIDNGLIYAALLTAQGKYLADFFLSADGDDILMDCDTAQAQGLGQRLNMYKLRADVALSVAELPVFCHWGSDELPGSPDPRHPELGTRHYGASDFGTEVDAEAYHAHRIRLGIPHAGQELVPNGTFILEAGFEALKGVDFRKGCYVGQEVTARMKHKTTLKKGIVPVTVEGAAPVGTEILSADGKVAGTLFSVSGGVGLAHLRFDRAEGELVAGDAKVRRV